MRQDSLVLETLLTEITATTVTLASKAKWRAGKVISQRKMSVVPSEDDTDLVSKVPVKVSRTADKLVTRALQEMMLEDPTLKYILPWSKFRSQSRSPTGHRSHEHVKGHLAAL